MGVPERGPIGESVRVERDEPDGDGKQGSEANCLPVRGDALVRERALF